MAHLVNVGFNLTSPLKDQIIKESCAIRDTYGSTWWVDNERYHLHLSVYLFDCTDSDFEKIPEVSSDLCKLLSRITVTITDVYANQSGLIFLAFSLPDALYEFHCHAVEAYNIVRNGMLREKYRTEEGLQTLQPQDREKVLKYGHIYVYDRYRPHVSIARIPSVEEQKVIVEQLKTVFVGKSCELDRFQVHEAFFGENDRTELIFDVGVIAQE